MTTEKVQIADIQPLDNNPRAIKDAKYNALKKSIKEFPEMLEIRPLVIDEKGIILGGNMRYRACLELGFKEIHIVRAENLTEEQKQEFIIKDNVSFGDWDWDSLIDDWDIGRLEDWTVKVPAKKNTELISSLKYKPVYYEPKQTPEIDLSECMDFSMYDKKVAMIDEYDLTKKQKDILKKFAYRFIRIDFERVANYYYFNATEEEQKVIERLRLVLIDDGADGFIEDDLLRILGFTDKVLGFNVEEND